MVVVGVRASEELGEVVTSGDGEMKMDVGKRIVSDWGKKISVVSSGKMSEVTSVELGTGTCVVVATSEVAGGEEMRIVSNAEVNSGNTNDVSAVTETTGVL